jgi:ribonuclease G
MTDVKSAAFSTPAELLGRVRIEASPFLHSNVERELERALHPRVYLRSGGHVVIEPTEALVSVDVNSGGSKGGADLEATALQTNLEAAEVIAQQIRLRDLGGILVIDFIDMLKDSHRDDVWRTFEGFLERDKGNPKIHGWADLGLMILSRRRRRMPLFRMLTAACVPCHGTGRVDGPGRVVERAVRACRAYLEKHPGQSVVVRTVPDLLPALRAELEDCFERIEFKGDRGLAAHHFRVDPQE